MKLQTGKEDQEDMDGVSLFKQSEQIQRQP